MLLHSYNRNIGSILIVLLILMLIPFLLFKFLLFIIIKKQIVITEIFVYPCIDVDMDVDRHNPFIVNQFARINYYLKKNTHTHGDGFIYCKSNLSHRYIYNMPLSWPKKNSTVVHNFQSVPELFHGLCSVGGKYDHLTN